MTDHLDILDTDDKFEREQNKVDYHTGFIFIDILGSWPVLGWFNTCARFITQVAETIFMLLGLIKWKQRHFNGTKWEDFLNTE